MLAITGLDYAYGRTPSLRGVGLTIGAGEIVCLLGPNGAGKSTLLKCIVGILRGSAGSVALHSKPIERYRRRERARAIAYVPQHTGTAALLSVAEMVALGRTPHRGLSTVARDRDIVWTTLERFDLSPLAFRPFGELSGGERQRVLIARTVAQESDIVLMDEPTNNLDPFYQMETLVIIRSIAKDDGKAVLVTLHDLSMAARLADRVALMQGGRIVASGPWRDALTPQAIASVYGVDAVVGSIEGFPCVVPRRRLPNDDINISLC